MQAQASKVKFDLGTVISSLTAKKNPDSLWTGPLVANLFVGGSGYTKTVPDALQQPQRVLLVIPLPVMFWEVEVLSD